MDWIVCVVFRRIEDDEILPDVSDDVKGWDIPTITGQVARFFVNNERHMCDSEAVATKMGGEERLHPPVLVEKALQELVDIGAVRVAKESVTPDGNKIKIYTLNDYILAQSVVAEIDGVQI